MAELVSLEAGVMLVRVILCLFFIIDIILLFRRDGQEKKIFVLRTSIRQELYSNLTAMISFVMALGLLLWMDVHSYRREGASGPVAIALDALILVLMLIYFSVPKRIVIGNSGIFFHGSLHGWKQLRSCKTEKNAVVVRRDRLFLIPPIRITGGDTKAIRKYIEKKRIGGEKTK